VRYMKSQMFLVSIVLSVFLAATFVAERSMAQSEQDVKAKPAASAKAPKKQSLNFEDELVRGSAQSPELFYLFQRKDVSQGRLIKLRQNFLPEMRKTTEDIQRIRGGR
jgi:hypothetical protein